MFKLIEIFYDALTSSRKKFSKTTNLNDPKNISRVIKDGTNFMANQSRDLL
jgi:hypothetical protein